MAKFFYSPTTRGFYINDVNGENIPPDALEISNTDYSALLELQTQGMVIQPDSWGHPVADASPPSPIPTSLTMKQARLALLNAGLYAQAQSAVAALTGTEGQKAQIEWEFSAAVNRGDALVVQLAAALGLTDAQLDDLFLAGSKL